MTISENNTTHTYCGASGSSLANLQQRVAIIGSPPLLDVIWRTQGTQNSNNRDWAELLLHDVYYHSQSRIHRSTKTTVARPQLTGSEEPATRAK
jgi:hypothetical protein